MSVAPLPDLKIPWTESPLFEASLAEAGLSEADSRIVRSFARDGLVVVDPGFDDFDAVADEIVGTLDGRYTKLPQQESARVPNAWQFCNASRRLAAAPEVHRILKMLYRAEPVPFQSINFERGSQQGLHSDALHFQSWPVNYMAGVWYALEDIDADNGPLVYYAGSHRLPILTYAELGLTASAQSHHKEFYRRYEAALAAMLEATGLERREAHLRKGQVVIWAANLAHGGAPVRDPARTRLSQVVHFFFEGFSYYTPMTSDLLLGKVTFRQPRNILTGEPLVNVYNGAPLEVA